MVPALVSGAASILAGLLWDIKSGVIMPKYAQFDPVISAPQQVIGWYDTEEFNYANLPPASNLLELTQAQWDMRFSTPFISGGQLIAAPPLTFAQTQASQLALLVAAYNNAIQLPVSYTSKGGVTQTYQADSISQDVLNKELVVYTSAGATPTGYYWVAADNSQVPFTLADLQGLATVMGAQGWAAFRHLQTQKAAVNAATTLTLVQAIAW